LPWTSRRWQTFMRLCSPPLRSSDELTSRFKGLALRAFPRQCTDFRSRIGNL
jgi:hypothetical protein